MGKVTVLARAAKLISAFISVVFISSVMFASQGKAQSGIGGPHFGDFGVGGYAQHQWALAMARSDAFSRAAAYKALTYDLASKSLACKTQNDCLQVPMGARECGGPATYVLTSKANPSLNDVVQSAQAATNADLAINNMDGVYGICLSELVPPFDCEAHVCKAVTEEPSAWGSPL